MKNKIIFLLFIILFSIKSFSQTDSIFENKEYRNGYISFTEIEHKNSVLASAKKESLVQELTGNQPGITFRRSVSDIPFKNGKRMQLEKYQLYKKGIRLRGGEYSIATVEDSVKFIHGFFAPFSSENFEKTYNLQTCIKLAINYFNQSHQVKSVTDSTEGISDTAFAVYYYDYALEKYRPAYQVQVTSKNSAYSENIFISAATGKFMGAENLICTINFPGTVQSQYSGARNIVADAPTVAGPFRMQETRGTTNVLIRTRNMNNRNDLTNVTDFVDNNNNWTTAEHGLNRAAFDVHWGAETVYDYWRNVHNRNSINGAGMAIESYVHWDVPNDPNDFNASWFQNSMRYGDGFGHTNPLTSLDICAHEFGHGIDQFTGDLLYERESGALDEGFADIWGASIEEWAKPASNQWLIGEEVLGGPIRNMANPNAFGQPDTYLGTNWVTQVGCTPSQLNDFCGVHTNSGVLDFWFFLLSQGGAGTNDIGNAYSVAGQGINTAANIAYATKQLAGGTTNYPTCRALSIQAARTLFGVCSAQEIAVTNAWFAVGVGAAYVPLTGVAITALKTSATGEPTTYLFTATQNSGATYTWYVGTTIQQTGSSNQFDWYFRCNVTQSVYCTASNPCASFTSNSISKTGECKRANSFTISPNPSSDIITISVSENKALQTSQTSFDQVSIYDIQGNLKRVRKFNKLKQATINIGGLNNGSYFIEIFDGTYKERQQLIIQK